VASTTVWRRDGAAHLTKGAFCSFFRAIVGIRE
jgi:hypothetical protein